MRTGILLTIFGVFLAAGALATVRHEPDEFFIRWDKTIGEGELLSFTIRACDPNGQRYTDNYLTIEIPNPLPGMVLSGAYPICLSGDCNEPNTPECDANSIVFSADFTWIPEPNQVGTHLVLVDIFDKAGNSDHPWLRVKVEEADVTPPLGLAD